MSDAGKWCPVQSYRGLTFLAIYFIFSILTPEGNTETSARNPVKKPRPPVGCPFGGRARACFNGEEHYGLICQSKYTNPTATADTTTTCMNVPPYN